MSRQLATTRRRRDGWTADGENVVVEYFRGQVTVPAAGAEAVLHREESRDEHESKIVLI